MRHNGLHAQVLAQELLLARSGGHAIRAALAGQQAALVAVDGVGRDVVRFGVRTQKHVVEDAVSVARLTGR